MHEIFDFCVISFIENLESRILEIECILVKNKRMKKQILSLLVVLALATASFALPQKPKQERLVNDYANVLNDGEERALEQKLVRFDSQTSTQIAFVSLKDLEGMSAIEMATRIMEKWGVGGAKDNGIVIVFKPKTVDSKGQIAITTGYGVEHLVTDALAKKVVEYDCIPFFKQGQIYEGIDNGTNVLMGLTKGEFTGSQYLEKRRSENKSSRSGGFFGIIIIIYIISRLSRARRVGGLSSHGSSLPFWLLLGMSGGSRGSGFSDFSSGSGSFGGGGFGGFGGGMGGGGGASGSW